MSRGSRQLNYVHMSTNATKAVGASALATGPIANFIGSVIINTKGASSNTLTLYDGSSSTGTVIAVIDTTVGESVLRYDVALTSGAGFTAVMATGTAADVTITYEA